MIGSRYVAGSDFSNLVPLLDLNQGLCSLEFSGILDFENYITGALAGLVLKFYAFGVWLLGQCIYIYFFVCLEFE
jgi:hypothetical protein